MLLRFRNNSTLRLLDRKHGSEIRYNINVFFANEALTQIIKYFIETADYQKVILLDDSHSLNEDIIRKALLELSDGGIPLSFFLGGGSSPGKLSTNK